MKKEMLAIVLIATVTFGLSGFVVAQTNDNLPPAGILPDNPFYGFKGFFEGLQLFLTFNPEGKANLHLQFAEQRLAELNQSIAENKLQNVQSLEKNYENELQGASRETNNTQALGRNATALAEHVAEETFKHTLVLEDLLNKVPAQAKVHIENAINTSEKGHDEAVQSILESRNVTGLVNLTFTIGNQTFTQSFNVTSGIGGKKIENEMINETKQNRTEGGTETATNATKIPPAATGTSTATCNCPPGFNPSNNGQFCESKSGRLGITACQ